MEVSGTAKTLSNRGAALLWDGRRLPVPWLIRQGIDTLTSRAREFGTATLVIRRSHHIACLAAYLPRVAESGLLITLASSDPAGASVAPYGGTRAVFTPDRKSVVWGKGVSVRGDFSCVRFIKKKKQ